MKKSNSSFLDAFYSTVAFVLRHYVISLVCVLLVAVIVVGAMVLPNSSATNTKTETVSSKNNVTTVETSKVASTPSKETTSSKVVSTASKETTSSKVTSAASKETTSSKVASTASKETTSSKVTSVASKETTSSKITSTVSKENVSSNKKPTQSKTEKTSSKSSEKTTYDHSKMTPDSNVFLDALEYTGYHLDVQRNSGMMWGSYDNYILCSQKKGLGWLSNITYDDYGRASGYETDENGKPHISYFENTGLVCASYVTYVYFNYLPNVAGIDTSMLARPEKSVLANDCYIAGKKWIEAGYSRYIDFTANDGGSINNDIKLTLDEEIPIGSLIVLCDWYNRSDWCSHICIYAGKKNGYHWVTHVGNENGPEFCAIERMNRKPHPQWPIAIITPPSNIDFTPKN